MSAEIQSDVDETYMKVWPKIENSFNARFEGQSFGSGLNKLTYIAIIRAIDSPDYGEITKYRKKEGSAEFRLKIPHERCLGATEQEFLRLLATSLGRAIGLLKGMKIPDFDCLAFEAEYEALCKTAWTT